MMYLSLALSVIAISFHPFTHVPASAPSSPQIQTLPPILIRDDLFAASDWTVTADTTGGASYTVSRRLTGGFGSPQYRFMSHRIPPVNGSSLANIIVDHLFTGTGYDPGNQGAITALDYSESGRILSFPFPDAFTTSQPVVAQGGQIFRSSRFVRFIAQNSAHSWETKSLLQLTAADFVAIDGSGAHPDFSAGGQPIQFGFSRSNSRSSTLPPVPSDEDLVIDHGADNFQIIVYRDPRVDVNLPPLAADDVFILNGYNRSLPLFEVFDVVRNDMDPNQDSLEISAIAQPLYGEVGVLSGHIIIYTLDESRASDTFGYTISDGQLTSDAEVRVWVDCACTVLCLNSLETASQAPNAPEELDLALIYRLRDRVMKTTPHGRRYVEMYYNSNPEILETIMLNVSLRAQALSIVDLWQANLRSLVDGNGSAVITQEQVDAVESFLSNLSAASGPDLQQIISEELARLGPLDHYVGLTVKEARRRTVGDTEFYLPLAFRSPR